MTVVQQICVDRVGRFIEQNLDPESDTDVERFLDTGCRDLSPEIRREVGRHIVELFGGGDDLSDLHPDHYPTETGRRVARISPH